MKLVDANVLLYAVNRQAQAHDASHRWLTAALSGVRRSAFRGRVCSRFSGFRPVHRVFASPLGVSQAMDLMEAWTGAPVAVIVEPTTRHTSLLRGMLEQAGTAGNLTTDAHLATLASEHRAEVITFDRDLARFGVCVVVPD